LNTFCKQDQKDLVCYLQRQLLNRDQRLAEQSYELEQLKILSFTNNNNNDDTSTNIIKKIVPLQVLRTNNPDIIISTVSQVSFYLFVIFFARLILKPPLLV